ncbi:Protein R08A2.7 [Aphelenchoides avenae]|nr:Protein R08A2.7 [Aphelenchus avenae]
MSSWSDTEDLVPPLYTDSYCELSRTRLVVRSYYFPIAKNKKVDVSEIQAVWYKEQSFSPLKCKEWGMALNTIHWALDSKRQLVTNGHFNVVVEIGSVIKVGFTVSDISPFLDQLKKVLSPDVPVNHDSLPF